MKSYCKEPYALVGHVRFCEGQKLEVKGGNIQMKNLRNAGKAHNTIYIYIYIRHIYNEWNLFIRPPTRILRLKIELYL